MINLHLTENEREDFAGHIIEKINDLESKLVNMQSLVSRIQQKYIFENEVEGILEIFEEEETTQIQENKIVIKRKRRTKKEMEALKKADEILSQTKIPFDNSVIIPKEEIQTVIDKLNSVPPAESLVIPVKKGITILENKPLEKKPIVITPKRLFRQSKGNSYLSIERRKTKKSQLDEIQKSELINKETILAQNPFLGEQNWNKYIEKLVQKQKSIALSQLVENVVVQFNYKRTLTEVLQQFFHSILLSEDSLSGKIKLTVGSDPIISLYKEAKVSDNESVKKNNGTTDGQDGDIQNFDKKEKVIFESLYKKKRAMIVEDFVDEAVENYNLKPVERRSFTEGVQNRLQELVKTGKLNKYPIEGAIFAYGLSDWFFEGNIVADFKRE